MAYANRYRCSGCSLTFTDPAEWRVQDRPGTNSKQALVMRESPLLSPHASGGL